MKKNFRYRKFSVLFYQIIIIKSIEGDKKMTIGERLKKIRLLLGLTQTEISQGVVTESFYSKVERNISKIKIEDLLAILNKNGVSLEDFFEIQDDERNKDTTEGLKKDLLLFSRQETFGIMELIFKEDLSVPSDKIVKIADLVITYLKRCYQEKWILEGKKTIEFIEKLPPCSALSLEKLLAQYYRALFDKDAGKVSVLKKLLDFNGYSHLSNKLPTI